MNKYKSLLLITLLGCLAFSYAEDASTSKKLPDGDKAFSSEFVVTPISVTLEQPGKPTTMNVTNQTANPLYVQTKLYNYTQQTVAGKLKEENTPVVSGSGVLVSPVILKDVPGNKSQILRVMALKQDPTKEISYRLLVKSLTPTNAKEAGALFTIGYSIPVFILPAKVDEKYDVKLVKSGSDEFLKLENTGNVHVTFVNVAVKGSDNKNHVIELDLQRLLAGQSELVKIPANIAKLMNAVNDKSVQISIKDLKNPDKKPVIKEFKI